MSTKNEKASRRSPVAPASVAVVTVVAVCLMVACLSTGSAQPNPVASAVPAEEAIVQRQQEETDPEGTQGRAEQQDDESVYEGIPAPAEPEPMEEDELAEPGESYLWGGRDDRRDDPTISAEGALTMFMRARNYRTIRILKSVMTTSLQASYDRDSARFNGKQNVRLSAFFFQPEDLKAVHYTGPKGAREPDIYDATVRSLWTDQGELADRRLEVVRLAQEESGLWRVGRLDIKESDKSRYQEKIPSVTSLRKVLRAWHRRQTALAEPLLSESFVEQYTAEVGGEEAGIGYLFEGDPSLRHAAFEIREILWEEETEEATAHVDLYVTARNRFGALDPHPSRFNLVRVGVGWYVDSWEEREETESAGL